MPRYPSDNVFIDPLIYLDLGSPGGQDVTGPSSERVVGLRPDEFHKKGLTFLRLFQRFVCQVSGMISYTGTSQTPCWIGHGAGWGGQIFPDVTRLLVVQSGRNMD